MNVASALLFDRDQVDAVDDWESCVDELGRSSILWIDIHEPRDHEVETLTETLGLDRASKDRLASADGGPFFGDFGSYLHVTAYAPASDGHRTELAEIDCLVADHWVVTIRDQPVSVIDDFRERARGSGDTGRLDGLEFLADLLEWVLNAYVAAFDGIEDALGEFDSRAMEGRLDDPEVELRRLVELRRQVGSLRRALVSHREMFLALTRPELEAIASSSHAERFGFLRSRLEDAVQGARDSRDSIVGSFDVLIARTEQRTNEIMKVLTLTSVLLLPGALIAGIMGMNFKVGLFQNAAYFWVVVGLIGGLAAATLLAARARKWI